MHLLRNAAMPAAVCLACSWAAAQDAEAFSHPLRGADGREIARISVSDGEIRYALQRPDGTWTDPGSGDVYDTAGRLGYTIGAVLFTLAAAVTIVVTVRRKSALLRGELHAED